MVSWILLPRWLMDSKTEQLESTVLTRSTPISLSANGNFVHLVGRASSWTLSLPSLPALCSCPASSTSYMALVSISSPPVPTTFTQALIFPPIWITIEIPDRTPCLQAAPLQSFPHLAPRVLFLNLNLVCLTLPRPIPLEVKFTFFKQVAQGCSPSGLCLPRSPRQLPPRLVYLCSSLTEPSVVP